MKFTVLWMPLAEDSLATLWMDASDREAVASAADRIDALWHQDPGTLGESRVGPARIVFQPPLSVTFEVSEADRIVHVLTVHRPRKS